jgi:hypothetical protein
MATGNITVTTAANFIPELWSPDCRVATEANLVMAKLVNRQFEGLIKQYGDTVHVGDISNLTVRAKAADTDVSFETITEGKFDLTINKHYYAAFKVEDIVKIQSIVDLRAKYAEKVGYALAKQIDSDLLGLYSDLSQSVGSAGVDITDANLRRAIQYLDDADAPAGERFLVIKPSQMNALLGIDKFVRADAVGYLAGMSPIVTGKLQGGNFNPAEVKGFFGVIYGVNVYVSTNVATSGTSPISTHNLLFHRDAFALAMQEEIRTQADYNIRSLATEVVADCLYGVGEFRDTFAVDIIT